MIHRGFYERYFISPFFRDFKNFNGKESRRDVLRTFMAWGVATLGITGVLLGQVGLLGPEVGFATFYTLGGLWLAWSFLSICALLARYSKSGSENGHTGEEKPSVVMLGIDKLLSTVCVLFFVLGLLMMITTLNSGELNMSTGSGEYDEDNPILNRDKVQEEAIFNYLNYDETSVAEKDTATVVEDEDTASVAEIYDPAAVSPVAQEDTTYIE